MEDAPNDNSNGLSLSDKDKQSPTYNSSSNTQATTEDEEGGRRAGEEESFIITFMGGRREAWEYTEYGARAGSAEEKKKIQSSKAVKPGYY